MCLRGKYTTGSHRKKQHRTPKHKSSKYKSSAKNRLQNEMPNEFKDMFEANRNLDIVSKDEIQFCQVEIMDPYSTFNLDFSSLGAQSSHRDIKLCAQDFNNSFHGNDTVTSLDDDDNDDDNTNANNNQNNNCEKCVMVHKCVLSMWSESFAVMCNSDGPWKDASRSTISIPTNSIDALKAFVKWIYAAPYQRFLHSSLTDSTIIQLLQILVIADMHQINELLYAVLETIIYKCQTNHKLYLIDENISNVMFLRKFIVFLDTKCPCILKHTFSEALRKIELSDIQNILLSYTNMTESIEMETDNQNETDHEHENQNGIDEDAPNVSVDQTILYQQLEMSTVSKPETVTEVDDIVWLIQHVGASQKFHEWFEFTLMWIFKTSSDIWFEKYASQTKWSDILQGWWVFGDKDAKDAQLLETATNSYKHAVSTPESSIFVEPATSEQDISSDRSRGIQVNVENDSISTNVNATHNDVNNGIGTQASAAQNDVATETEERFLNANKNSNDTVNNTIRRGDLLAIPMTSIQEARTKLKDMSKQFKKERFSEAIKFEILDWLVDLILVKWEHVRYTVHALEKLNDK